jgi:2-polyprenyl-3-methyl-5-hydroxy-6-metoxy-1,4-benzoquinol methylase/glycosyltransferase involved in cell wall biosynthesis
MRLSICFTIDSVAFTADVIAGRASLGGSESACLGLARGLQARGHDVHIFTSQLGQDAPAQDHGGVTWHDMDRLQQWAIFKDWDVAIALRQPTYLQALPAKFRILWCQDLMSNQTMMNYVMSLAWTYDAVAYVSEYHRHQWEAIAPELKRIGWATKNGHDAELALESRVGAAKNPNQVIHISRPERGLMPLLTMWPAVRAARPEATLAICRYSSMYDPQGWGEVCKSFDADVEAVNQAVGGITWLGELGKPALYKALAESAVMWYPGVSDFAETSCIAAIEAQACGTPIVASFKGALPETAPAAVLIPGVAESDEAYHLASVTAVVEALDGCKYSSFRYRQQVKQGLAQAQQYTYEGIAAEWESFLLEQFRARYEADKAGVLRRLDHDDDLAMACVVAQEMGNAPEAVEMRALSALVMSGQDHTPEDFAHFALDPIAEMQAHAPRHMNVVKQMAGCRHVLDVACGSGAFAILLALDDQNRTVTAVDYSPRNIEVAKAAAEQCGVADRITFVAAEVWNMETQEPSEWLKAQPDATYDGLWCGEFIEHVQNCSSLVDELERTVKHMGRVIWSCPLGPLGDLVSRHDALHRGHVHRFRPQDLDALFSQKNAYVRLSMPWASRSGRGEAVGQWILSYRRDGVTGTRPMERRVLTRPYARLSAGIITNDTTDLRRCLDAVWPLADEIVLGDCGCRAGELDAIVAEFPRKTRVMQVGAVHGLEGGFSEARNAVLSASSGEWFMWIDSDEMLCGAQELGKYLDSVVFRGYSIPQNHLHLDASMATDLPVRVFRRGPDIQFYGCIHEQPQMGDCNGDIMPALQVSDVQIAHTGYLHEAMRRDKALNRNLPLLVRDQKVFPDRVLGKLLVLRDHANLALWGKEGNGGKLTEKGRHHYGQVIALFEELFSDPAHKFHAIAKPFYESALKEVVGAIEVEIGVAGQPGGLGENRAKSQRVWVRTVPQLRTLLESRVEAMLASLETKGMDCEPIVARPSDLEVSA